MKRKKEFILMRKQYIDKDGVLIKDKTDLIKEKSKLKLIQGLDLAHVKSDEAFEPAGFRPDSPLSPPLEKKQSMELRDNIDMQPMNGKMTMPALRDSRDEDKIEMDELAISKSKSTQPALTPTSATGKAGRKVQSPRETQFMHAGRG